jgi:hypothetical protein
MGCKISCVADAEQCSVGKAGITRLTPVDTGYLRVLDFL